MPPSPDPSVASLLEQIKQKYPDTPFLALGQTVLWDEPVKAVWRLLLDRNYPQAEIIAGVHDTDYFAKTVAHIGTDRKYVALPHDDGRTRDLWSAAGEMSSLFGSESVPTRAVFEKHGVPFDLLAEGSADGRDAFFREHTVAWGWRGIVSTESHDVIAHDIPVLEIQQALLEQMDWAFAETLACLESAEARERAAQTAAQIRGWITDFLETCDANCRLSDLYQTLIPRLYTLLLGEKPAHLATTASTELFLFNSQTCHQPRFALLTAFLDPRTRRAAVDAYDKAVAGSGIYDLAHFGDGAIPFDVVLPGHGRGTLRLTAGGVIVETQPVAVTVPGVAQTPAALAALLEQTFGANVVLVGKAVTLVDMLAAEFLVVFHETASGYTPRTHAMNERLRQAGVHLDLHPIVRLTYPTWDALAALPEATLFRLPTHLARAFGLTIISAPNFARQWRSVLEQQRQALQTVRSLSKTRDLMRYLARQDTDVWRDRPAQYEAALNILKQIAEKSDTLASRIDEHEQEWQMWKDERLGLERRKGEDWRAHIQPMRERLYEAARHGADTANLQHDLARQLAIRATAFDDPLTLCKERIDATRTLIAEFRRQRRLLERSPAARDARQSLRDITRDAEMARLALVRTAFLTVEGLEHTNLRPTAWWLPMVDPDGAWLRAIAENTKAHLEEL